MAGFVLNSIPPDVQRIILKVQAELKLQKNVSQFSQQKTVFHIITQYQELTEKKKPS